MDKITKVEVMTRPEKLEELKEALNRIGVTGMTVSNVFGCGLSKGHKAVYRGRQVEVSLQPKIKVEVVICEIPVETVVSAIEAVCSTGHIGDGKIFISGIEDAVKIRTGERGRAAIVDDHE